MNFIKCAAYSIVFASFLVVFFEITCANASRSKHPHPKKAREHRKQLGRTLVQKYKKLTRKFSQSESNTCAKPPSIAPLPCSCGITKSYENSIKSPFGESYVIGKTQVSFIQGIEECRKNNMVLVSIDFPQENEFLKTQIKDLDADIWTSGISTKGPKQIFWTGTGMFLHYHSPEWKRANDTNNANCLAVKPNGAWHLKECKDKSYYVCEQINT